MVKKSFRLIFILLIGFILGFISKSNTPNVCILDSSLQAGCYHVSDVLISDGYHLICHDAETDIAYYAADADTIQVAPNTPVVLATGAEGITTLQTLGGFLVNIPNSLAIHGGLSGTPVLSADGNMLLGYVSSAINDYTLYCVVAN